MNINGIIAEYNPFHNGHVHQMNSALQVSGAEKTVVVMSGNFVQRGEPAIVDKFTRAKMALMSGADMVIELPFCYACSSADYFSRGAVSLLAALGIVTHVAFGMESGTVGELEPIAEILIDEPETYKKALNEGLKMGLAYPLARNNALVLCNPEITGNNDLLSSPNNILALEYIKQIKKYHFNLTPISTLRNGAGYYDRFLDTSAYASAMAIRHAVSYGEDVNRLKEFMPDSAFDLLSECINTGRTVFADDFSEMLLFKLIKEREEGYTRYLDVSEELSDRIVNHLPDYKSFSSFCELLKSKDRTYTRISRTLIHILLDITSHDLDRCGMVGFPPYARLLGFRRDSEDLLSKLKTSTSIPIITKYSDAKEKLTAEGMSLLKKNILCDEIYNSVIAVKSGNKIVTDFSNQLVVV